MNSQTVMERNQRPTSQKAPEDMQSMQMLNDMLVDEQWVTEEIKIKKNKLLEMNEGIKITHQN